jgi:hypothetical protein
MYMNSNDSDYADGLNWILNLDSWSRWSVLPLESYPYVVLSKAIVIKFAGSILFRLRQVLKLRNTTRALGRFFSYFFFFL